MLHTRTQIHTSVALALVSVCALIICGASAARAQQTDALAYLRQIGKSDGKTRDLFKLLEQAVFHHTGRIEAMRRETPPDYAVNVRAALLAARELRTNALNAFYGNTVLREEPATTKAP